MRRKPGNVKFENICEEICHVYLPGKLSPEQRTIALPRISLFRSASVTFVPVFPLFASTVPSNSLPSVFLCLLL